MIRLSKEQVISLHKRLIEATGGSDGIRDEGMQDILQWIITHQK